MISAAAAGYHERALEDSEACVQRAYDLEVDRTWCEGVVREQLEHEHRPVDMVDSAADDALDDVIQSKGRGRRLSQQRR